MVSDVGGMRVKIVNSPFCHPRLEMECGYSLNRVSGCLSFFPGRLRPDRKRGAPRRRRSVRSCDLRHETVI
jgi:hypothetical protein